MSVDVGSVGWRMESSDTILKNYHLRTILHKLVPIRHVVSEKKILKIFPIGSYVKTMSVDVGSLGWWMGSSDTILKGDHLRTISSKFGPILAKQFQRRRFLNIFPIGSYVKTKSADVGCLGWRVGSSDTILKWDHLRTIPGPNSM